MKARDIIPGWPRGRSTSRPLKISSSYIDAALKLKLYVFPRFGQMVGRIGPYYPKADFERDAQDGLANSSEDQRKAAMMEAWHAIERNAARGFLLPSPIERRLIVYGTTVTPAFPSPYRLMPGRTVGRNG